MRARVRHLAALAWLLVPALALAQPILNGAKRW
jgi:hypothetical protein